MKSLKHFLPFVVMLLAGLPAYAQTWDDLFVFQDSSDHFWIDDFAVFSNQDIAFCGAMSGHSFTYRDSTYVPETGTNPYRTLVVGRLSPSGELRWFRAFGSSSSVWAGVNSQLAITSDDKLYVAATSSEAILFPAIPDSQRAFFLLAFSDSGEIRNHFTPSLDQMSGVGDTIMTSLILTPDEHLAFGIQSPHDFTLGGTSFTSQSPPMGDPYYLEFDTTLQFVQGLELPLPPYSMAVNETGRIYMTDFLGIRTYNPQLAPGTFFERGNANILSAVPAPDGGAFAIMQMQEQGGNLVIGSDTLQVSTQGRHLVVAKLSATMKLQWSLPIGLSGSPYPEYYVYQTPEMAVDQNGDLLFTSYTRGGLAIGSRILTPPNTNQQHFTAKANGQTGELNWLTFGGGYLIAAPGPGNQLLFSGRWTGDLQIGDTTLTSPPQRTASLIGVVRDDYFPKIPNVISGVVYRDGGGDCSFDSGDTLVGSQMLVVNDQIFVYTQPDGSFSLEVDTGQFNIRLAQPFNNNYFTLYCPQAGHNVAFDTLAQAVGGIHFGIADLPDFCPPVTVSITTTPQRPCRAGEVRIRVNNPGSTDLPPSSLRVDMPVDVQVTSASLPYTATADSSILSFDLPAIPGYSSFTLTIHDFIRCAPEELLGQSACFRAELEGIKSCAPMDPNWNQADLRVQGECLAGKFHVFRIFNNGLGDMTDSVSYFLYQDTVLYQTGKIWLASGDTLILQFPGNGFQSYLQLQQVAFHPSSLSVTATITNCAWVSSSSPPVAVMYPPDDDNSSSIRGGTCIPYGVSFDPNDKTVWPAGIPPYGIVQPETPLRFRIRFQNTGNDTAFKVVLVDTLSTLLDVQSFRPLSASHPYQMSLSTTTPQVLSVTFDPIFLPDSTTDEPGSHGMFSYLIRPKPGLPEGTVIENFADIYFDFNKPVRTDTTLTTYQEIEASGAGPRISPCQGGQTPANPDAGPDQVACEGSVVQLASQSDAPVFGTWVSPATTVSILQPDSLLTDVVIDQPGDFEVVWQQVTCGTLVSDTVRIQIKPRPDAPVITQSQPGMLGSTATYDSYQWFFNGLLVGTDSVITPTEAGSYTLIGSVDSCGSPASEPFRFDWPSAEGLRARFWRSSTGEIMVTLEGPAESTCTGFLADLRGQTILTFELEIPANGTLTTTLGTIRLPNGVYYYRLIGAGEKVAGTIGLFSE